MTQQQIIGVVVSIIVLVLVLLIAKKVLKLVLCVAVVVCSLVYFGIVSPQQLQDVGQFVQDNSDKVKDIIELAKDSDYIKTITSGGDLSDIKLQVGNEWVSLDMIENVINVNDDKCTLTLAGHKYTIEDENVVKLITMFEESRFNSSGMNNLAEALGR